MVFFHEIVGPILASVAVILTLILFKKTLDFQAYRELDLNYIEILKIGIEKADILEKEYMGMYSVERKIYDQYASMVLALIETIYDRNKVDKNWYPYIRRERNHYLEWFKYKDHNSIFNTKFKNFVFENKNFEPVEVPPVTRRRKLGNVIKEYWFLFLAIVIIIIIVPVSIFPELLYDLEYLDRKVSIDCARDYRAYNVSQPSDCSQFSSGSLAELCAVDPKEFNLSNKSGCAAFITPGMGFVK